MTPAGVTPEPMWLSVEIRDAVPGDEAWDNFFKKWITLTEEGIEFQKQVYSKSGKPCRRLIDPCEPLRAELREAYSIIQAYYHVGIEIASGFPAEVEQWLARNAGFGPGKEGA